VNLLEKSINPMTPRYLVHPGIIGTAFLMLGGYATADIIHLKDGRELEGKIVRESEDSYVLDVRVAPGIRDEITVTKDEVLLIEPELPDLKDFAELQQLLPIPDLLTLAEYSQRIESVQKFISTYPESQLLDQAREIMGAHLAEKEVIEAGGLKLNGKLIAAEDRFADKYEIDSRAAEAKIRELAQKSNHLQALRAFKVFDAEFNGSEAWRGLLPLALQLASSHKARAQELLDGFDIRQARQESGLSRMGVEERLTAMRAIADREAALSQRHEQERNHRDLWPSVSPDFRPSLEDTVRFADQEIRRLATVSTQPLRHPTPSQLWRNAIAAIQEGNSTQMRTAIQAARSARMPQAYIDELQVLADEALRKAEEARKLEAERIAEEAKRLAEEKRLAAEKLAEEARLQEGKAPGKRR